MSNASLGSLVVSLAMDTARFTGDVGKAAQQMSRLTAEAGKVGAAIGANIVAGAAVFQAIVVAAVDAADRTGELAEMLSLTTETMSGLGYAAKMSAIDQETLAASFTKLAKISTEAASGNEAASTAFKTLGISAKNADGSVKPLDKLLGEMADKFSGYREGTEKTALAMEFFGKSGAAMVPLLNRGSEGIADLVKEAQALGIVLSKEAADAAGEFNDRLDQLRAAKEGLGLQIARQLLPTLNSLTGSLFAAAKEAGGFEKAAIVAATGVKILFSSGALLVGIFKTIGEYIGGVGAAAVALFSGRFEEAAFIASEVGNDLKNNIKGTVGNIAAIWDEGAASVQASAPGNAQKFAAPIVRAAEKVKKEKSDIEKSIEEIEKRLSGMRLEVDTQGASDRTRGLIELLRKPGFTGAQVEEYLRLSKQIEEYKQKVEAAEKAERSRQEVMSEGVSVFEATRTPSELLSTEIDRLNYLLEKGAINWDTYARAVFAAQDKYDEASKGAAQVADTVGDFVKRARENIQDSIGDGLVQAMNGNFKDIGNAFVQMLQRMVAEALAAKLMSALFGDAKAGGTGGGGVFGNILHTIGSALFGGKAYGGPVSAGRAVKVGEHEPEVFIPSVSGTIVPESRMRGQSNIVVQVTATPGMNRQTALQQGQQIGEGIQRAMARNG